MGAIFCFSPAPRTVREFTPARSTRRKLISCSTPIAPPCLLRRIGFFLRGGAHCLHSGWISRHFVRLVRRRRCPRKCSWTTRLAVQACEPHLRLPLPWTV